MIEFNPSNYIDPGVLKDNVGETYKDYSNNNGNIDKDGMNKFLSDAISTGNCFTDKAACSAAKGFAGDYFDSIDANKSGDLSVDEIDAFLSNSLGTSFDEIQSWSVEELVDFAMTGAKPEIKEVKKPTGDMPKTSLKDVGSKLLNCFKSMYEPQAKIGNALLNTFASIGRHLLDNAMEEKQEA